MPILYCQNGHHPWERPAQRGRKPFNCPAHLTEEPIKLSERDSARFSAAKGKPLPQPAKPVKTAENAPQPHTRTRQYTHRHESIATILTLNPQCRCNIHPEMSDRELRQIRSCTPDWVCPTLDKIRRLFVTPL